MKYNIGLDIGITSVGWSIINLDKNKIQNLGVRIFDKAENEDGSSLASSRRDARGKRRLIRRKAYRVKRVKKLILSEKILSEYELDNLFNNKQVISVLQARTEGLERLLTDEEWAKILINLCKRRGFKSNRKNEAKDKDTGKILSNIKSNLEKIEEMEVRTIGELMYNEIKNSDDKYRPYRNKFGDYSRCVSRDMILKEIDLLFDAQRKFGNKYATQFIQDKYLLIFNSQRPYSKFSDLEKLVGWCTFEKNEKRVPKNCISFEEFVLYQTINKLSIVSTSENYRLSNEQRELIANEALSKKEIKYSNLRKILSLNDDERFSTLSYGNKSFEEVEKVKFVSLIGFYEIKKALKKYWNEVKDNRQMLNDIAYVLTLGKTDEEIMEQLKNRNVPDYIAESVIDLSFSKFGNLSVKAIDKILPFLKEGYQYHEACEKVGYDFKARYKGEKFYKLPKIDIQEIVNPVVVRALSQVRKVVNSIIDKYGSPYGINIELARDIAKSFDERRKITKKQEENRDNIDKFRQELENHFGKVPNGSEILKYRLWKEQGGWCAYSQQQISLEMLFSVGECEIDHIIPHSRSFDDSLSNKVLVLSRENQRKGNRTPYEYFENDIERWNRFEIWVKGSKLSYTKKENLLKKEYISEGWKSRNLQDTRYIARYILNFINDRLKFSEGDSKKRVIAINGQATSYLRKIWRLHKSREESDKHHALDATIVAVATDSVVRKISLYNKAFETNNIIETYVDPETNEKIDLTEFQEYLKQDFPEPWQGFSAELKLRLSDKSEEELRKECKEFYNDEDFINKEVKPILVSRVPVRKIKGQLFKETVYSKKAIRDNYFVRKKELIKLTKEDLGNIYNYFSDKRLYDSIISRMEEFNYNAKEAFKGIFRKPTKNGELGPVVRSIKIKCVLPFKDGIELNKGFVGRTDINRIDIYEKLGTYYCVPVYNYQLLNGNIPNRAVKANAKEEDWPVMDETYMFKYSIYKNELIEIKSDKKCVFGYFNSFDRSTGNFKIILHDSKKKQEKVGLKKYSPTLKKYEVDVLGNYYEVKEGNKRK